MRSRSAEDRRARRGFGANSIQAWRKQGRRHPVVKAKITFAFLPLRRAGDAFGKARGDSAMPNFNAGAAMKSFRRARRRRSDCHAAPAVGEKNLHGGA
jgi:hypothetical protein